MLLVFLLSFFLDLCYLSVWTSIRMRVRQHDNLCLRHDPAGQKLNGPQKADAARCDAPWQGVAFLLPRGASCTVVVLVLQLLAMLCVCWCFHRKKLRECRSIALFLNQQHYMRYLSTLIYHWQDQQYIASGIEKKYDSGGRKPVIYYHPPSDKHCFLTHCDFHRLLLSIW